MLVVGFYLFVSVCVIRVSNLTSNRLDMLIGKTNKINKYFYSYSLNNLFRWNSLFDCCAKISLTLSRKI